MLARKFFLYKKNSKVNNSQFYNNYTFSRGTVYFALNFLIKNKAIKIKNKTKDGSYIDFIDYSKLFELSKEKIILCVSPIPLTMNLKIISSALEYIFKQNKIPFELLYKPGSLKRAELLEDQLSDIGIMSKIAAKKIVKKYSNLNIPVELGVESYTSSHAIIFSKAKFKKIEDGMIVGIDENSIDIAVLTKEIIGNKKVKLVNKKYHTLIEDIQNKKIDAVIYNIDDAINNIKYVVPIKSFTSNKQLLIDSTVATLVINKNNQIIKNIFKNIISEDKLLEAIERIKKDPNLINY